MMTSLAIAVYLLTADPPPAYPNPALLVEVGDLKPEAVRLLDVRGKAKYEAGHIPGAVLVDFAPWSKAVTAGKADAAFWKAEIAAVGVAPGRPVVVYGDDPRDVCRAWWMLKFAGVPDARVLNGGWKTYTAAKLPEQKDPVVGKAEPHDWALVPGRFADKQHVLDQLNKQTTGIVDARSPDEFTGRAKLSNKRAGCVPGAAHLEWSELLDPATGKFLAPDQLAKLIKDRNIDLAKPQVTYCQSGGRAAVLAFGLELMGAKNVRNYYASWGEWGNSTDTPVATPGKE
ncbi:MAG: rhdA 1 [Gemmataceae bacterium]|nr:rhdA 1 [Gemmataceae bacterium]